MNDSQTHAWTLSRSLCGIIALGLLGLGISCIFDPFLPNGKDVAIDDSGSSDNACDACDACDACNACDWCNACDACDACNACG